ncbi:hypothetical protein WA026_015292 [Henosepilachna vigintioctopunctata]|uniref:Carboxylic ester hydrolase n=1 Tax=Henosepilachna vigintioctopunctata TaxID=420089 RepID=A0AAW1TVC1_9CUCU
MRNCRIVLIVLEFLYVEGLKPVVEIPSLGVVEGQLDESANGRSFYSFEGIPYANPPIGTNRFKEPRYVTPWSGIWKANKKIVCLQYNFFPFSSSNPIEGDEDCLYLNIYTPKLDGNFSVLVNIHGGSFLFGSGVAARPNLLLDRDIVTVTFNYRLGALGFLSTEDDTLPGNNGFKDQIMALRWIKKNIIYFGGDPNSITIFGTSSGGVCVHFHTMCPKSKDLFNRAISSSGCAMNPWALMRKPLQQTQKLAVIFNCDFNNTAKMIDCLSEVPGTEIVATVREFQSWEGVPFAPFAMVVDKWSSDPVLPKHPYKLLSIKSINDVPWMLSQMAGEGYYNGFKYYDELTLKHLDTHWNELIPLILHYNSTISHSDRNYVNQKIRKEYFSDEQITLQNVRKLINMIGDRLFKSDFDKCIRLHATAIKSQVYHYLFTYRGEFSLSELYTNGSNKNFGAVHADDITYIFQMPNEKTEEDKSMSELLLDIYVSFARDGKPFLQSTWSPAAKNITKLLNFLNIASPSLLTNERPFSSAIGSFGTLFLFMKMKNFLISC